MAKRLVFCILLFSISLTSYARFDEYTAEKALYRAKRLHKELIMDNTKPAPDDFKQVFAAYRSVIERFPKWEQREIVLLIIGDLYSENKQYEEAKESYLDIIRISYQNMMAKLPVNINIAARARYKIALNYEKQGNWPLAEENLIKVAADYPNTLDALFVPLYRAEYYYKEGNQERAEKIYQEALGRYLEIIDTKPKSRLAFTARKLIEKSYENVQKWEEMAETLRQAIKNNPNAKVAFVELGKIYQRQNKIEEAIQTFKKVIERYPDYLEAQLDLGKLYNDIGRFDLALEVAEKISKKQEYNIGAIVLKGYTHFYKRSYSSALKFFKRAINLGSNNPEIYNLIGVIQLKFSKYEEAREALEASLELQPDSAPVHVNLGNLYMAEGKYELAEKEYLTAIKHDNRLLAAYANLANLKVNRRQMDKAVEIYEQMLTINPKLYLVEYHIGEVYEFKEEYDKAIDHYKETIEKLPRYWESYNNLAYIYASKGNNLDEALKLIKQANKLYANNSSVLDTQGFVYYQMKQYQQAEESYLQAVKIAPNHPYILFHLGLLYRDQKKPEQAKKYFTDALANGLGGKLAAEAKKNLQGL